MRFVAIGDLQPGMVLGRKIINQKKTSLLEKGVILSDMLIARLKKNGYIGVYVADEFSKAVQLQETVREEIIEDAIDAVAEANIASIIQISSELVRDISNIDDISLDLVDIRSYDDYTYHHCVNVAVYAAAVATRMGLPEEQIQEIAVAALCHDLGKSRIDPAIINKKERLTDEEYEEIKKHPKYGYDLLDGNPMISDTIRRAVLCHHENENGTGYLMGLMGDSVPLYAKIIHAVDVYDALTSRRPYKDPYAPVDALEYMIGGMDILFDARVVEIMQTVIPVYPPGMDVGLSNGERAVVLAHTSQALRPKIKIYETGREVDLSTSLQYRMVFIISSGVLMQSGNSVEVLNEERGKDEKKKVIVVVDDSRISLEQTRVALEGEYEVITLESGLACLKYFAVKGVPDLLIMDIDMPGMDGMVTVEKLREKKLQNLNVMFLTAIANRETVLRCNRAGAKDYILKPVNPVYLRERVRIALDRNMDR